MIKSELFHGKIYAGYTELACTIRVEQTAPMQLTVRAGEFTHTNGDSWTLEKDKVLDFTSDPIYPKEIGVELMEASATECAVWSGTRLLDGTERLYPPPDRLRIHDLVIGSFVIPPECSDLKDIDIFVLTVLPGFPEGTTAADWKMQTGRV